MQLHDAEQEGRHLALPGSYNIRELGGYPTTDGRRTRWRALLRADSLHGLDAAAQAILLEYGVGSMIDLRRPEECARWPNVFAESTALQYTSISLLPDAMMVEVEPRPDLTSLYCRLLDSAQAQLRAVLTTVSQAPGAVLIHCSAGKDRTGIVAALLLGMAGVPDELIVADYALTSQYITPLLARLRADAEAAGRDLATFERMLESRPETMVAMLDYLRERYDGVTGYAATIGLDDAELAAIRARLVA